MKVINTVIALGESPSPDLKSQKLTVTRDPAGPFKATEELEIGLDVKEVTVRAIEDSHVSVCHSVVNTNSLESGKITVGFQAGYARAPSIPTHPLILDSTEQDDPVGASELLGVLAGSIEAAGEEETTDGSSAGADGAAAKEGGSSEDTSNESPDAATGDGNEVESDSKEN